MFGLALQTKLFVVLALPAIALAPLTQCRTRTDLRRSAIDLLIFLAAAAGVFCILAVLFKIPLYSQLVRPHVDAETATDLAGVGGFKTVLSSLRPEFFVLTAAAGAGVFVLRRQLVYAIPIVWLAVAGAVLIVHRPFWDHHALLLMVPIAWLTGQALLLVQLLPRRQAASWAFAALIAAVAAHDFVKLSKQMRRLVEQDLSSPMLLSGQREGNWVVTDYAMDAYRAHSVVPPELAVYSSKRRAVGRLSDRDVAKIAKQYRPTEILLRRFAPSPEIMAVARESYRPVSAPSHRFDAIRSDVIIPGQEAVDPKLAIDALAAAASDMSSRATEGGYPGHFDLTNGNRYGRTIKNEPLQPNEIIVRPPGATQEVGQCMRGAYRATGRDVFRRAAISAGRALACAQRDAGGWNQIATLHEPCDAPRIFNVGSTPEPPMTLDDGATPSAISFLLDIRADLQSEGAQPPDWLQPALDVSLQALLDAQDQNGGWPQQIPAGGEHNAKYTFNDGAMQSAIEVLFKAYRQLGDHRFFTAAMNGAMFIIATQGPGLQAGWGQQYDKKLAVSSGRNFEPPGYASRETGEIVNTLLGPLPGDRR